MIDAYPKAGHACVRGVVCLRRHEQRRVVTCTDGQCFPTQNLLPTPSLNTTLVAVEMQADDCQGDNSPKVRELRAKRNSKSETLKKRLEEDHLTYVQSNCKNNPTSHPVPHCHNRYNLRD